MEKHQLEETQKRIKELISILLAVPKLPGGKEKDIKNTLGKLVHLAGEYDKKIRGEPASTGTPHFTKKESMLPMSEERKLEVQMIEEMKKDIEQEAQLINQMSLFQSRMNQALNEEQKEMEKTDVDFKNIKKHNSDFLKEAHRFIVIIPHIIGHYDEHEKRMRYIESILEKQVQHIRIKEQLHNVMREYIDKLNELKTYLNEILKASSQIKEQKTESESTSTYGDNRLVLEKITELFKKFSKTDIIGASNRAIEFVEHDLPKGIFEEIKYKLGKFNLLGDPNQPVMLIGLPQVLHYDSDNSIFNHHMKTSGNHFEMWARAAGIEDLANHLKKISEKQDLIDFLTHYIKNYGRI